MKRKNKQKSINNYLSARSLYPPLILADPEPDLQMIVIIPSFDEHDLDTTLKSLELCYPTQNSVEVIVMINDKINTISRIKDHHKEQYHKLIRRKGKLRVHTVYIDNMPVKKGGVGYARKVGMDEALNRLNAVDAHDGILICLDADCKVNLAYLSSIESFYSNHQNQLAAICHYEHPIDEFGEVDCAIIDYEAHLRMLSCGLKWVSHPHSIQTVGSTMTVRAYDYAAQGGMNTRQAGEDFYFIQKLIKSFPVATISEAIVYPSSRTSERVPFGTGAAMNKLTRGLKQKTYQFSLYKKVKMFFDQTEKMYASDQLKLDPVLDHFLGKDLDNRLKEIRKHSASLETFEKRFFRWFDIFQCIKFFHYARKHGYPDQNIDQVMNDFGIHTNSHFTDIKTKLEKLCWLREIDRNS